MRIAFRILGPLELSADGRVLPLGSPKQRALLALLLVHGNETLSRERLIEELWAEAAPATVASALHVYLSRLRRLLESAGSGGVLVRDAYGYRLRVEPEQLDANRFERLVGEGREALAAGKEDVAAERLRQALALWRGRALADLRSERFAITAGARLDEQRISALEQRLEADLALGRHRQLIGELETLVSEHPYRERLRAQLMLALYRSGRQAEALRAYQDARHTLANELGLEPGQELKELEQAILRQDPELGAAATVARARPAVPASRGENATPSDLPPRGPSGREEQRLVRAEPRTLTIVDCHFRPVIAAGSEASQRRLVSAEAVGRLTGRGRLKPASHDPELLYALVVRSRAEAAGVLAGRGGEVERRAEESLIAVFGLRPAANGHQVAAVRAVITLRERMLLRNRELEESHPFRVAVGVGIGTGEAVAGIDFDGPYVFGDAVTVATHLADAAASPLTARDSDFEVFVDAVTYKAVRETFKFRSSGLTLSFLPAWRLCWPEDASGRTE